MPYDSLADEVPPWSKKKPEDPKKSTLDRIENFLENVLRGVVAIVGIVVIGFFMWPVVNSTGTDYSSMQSQAALERQEAEAEVPYDNYHPIDRNADRATEDAERAESMEIEASQSQLDRMYEEGQQAAADPSAIQNPGLVDCDYFEYRDEANAFYRGAGGPEVDYFWLDDDRDGVACETLPRWIIGAD